MWLVSICPVVLCYVLFVVVVFVVFCSCDLIWFEWICVALLVVLCCVVMLCCVCRVWYIMLRAVLFGYGMLCWAYDMICSVRCVHVCVYFELVCFDLLCDVSMCVVGVCCSVMFGSVLCCHVMLCLSCLVYYVTSCSVRLWYVMLGL